MGKSRIIAYALGTPPLVLLLMISAGLGLERAGYQLAEEIKFIGEVLVVVFVMAFPFLIWKHYIYKKPARLMM